MKEKFIKIKTIHNSGGYENLINTCFFISISDVLKEYGININPIKLREIFNFSGKNYDLFDTDLHLNDDFTEGLRKLNMVILIYPYCPKYGAINSEIYYKLKNDQTNNELIIPIVCFQNVHFEPIVDTLIPVYENFNCKNLVNEHIIIPTRKYYQNQSTDIKEDEIKNTIYFLISINQNLLKKIQIIKNYVKENHNKLKYNDEKYNYIKEKYNKIKDEIEENEKKINKLKKLII